MIPAGFASLQAELDAALAPFRRGGPAEFPPEKLAFDDITDTLRALHRAVFRFERSGRDGLSAQVLGGGGGGRVPDTYHLDLEPVRELMLGRGLAIWSGRLSEIEPDFDAFAGRFSCLRDRNPVTGGWGQSLNPLGRWDWWDLGGRFDGAISGQKGRSPVADGHMVSSGPSPGRSLVGGIAGALGAALPDAEAETEANVEPVAALLAATRRGDGHALPHTIVLPRGGGLADELRWLDRDGRREVPAGAKAALRLASDADFAAVALAAYERYEAFAAAGVSYHL